MPEQMGRNGTNKKENRSLAPYQFTLESAISEWIAEKVKRTNSARTEKAYRETMSLFREFLQLHGYDLLSDALDIARIASLWANARTTDKAGPVSPGTYNQRLAILSSFYTFIQDTYHLDLPNPIKSVKKRPVQAYAAALPLDSDEVSTRLAAIDRSSIQGKRDYAILAIALYTGRRASELVGLRGKDVKIVGRRNELRVTLTFHCKGAKIKKDKLDIDTSSVFLDYLHGQYGKQFTALTPDAPLWVSCSRHNSGQAIGAKTLSNICEHYLDTSKVHALRHTWTVGMVRSGAPITEISDRLGHTDIKTTQVYTREIMGDDNPYGEKLSARFGIKRRATSK